MPCRSAVRNAACLLMACCAWSAAAAGAADECAGRPPATPLPGGIAAAAAKVTPALVTVYVLRPVSAEAGEAAFVRRETPANKAEAGEPGAQFERSFSSGFVLAADGVVVASAHAIAGAREVLVLLGDGRLLPARVLGSDGREDLALLDVGAGGLPSAQPATRPLCAGDVVAAAGAPFEFDGSVTAGVVSAPARLLPGTQGVPLIQTDVALNPGSSGGPLFDLQGEVVGMSSMVYSDTGVYMGISFAVPIARVLRLVQDVRAGRAGRRDLGWETQPLSAPLALAFGLPDVRGALVTAVRGDGAAASAGVRPGDVVLAVQGVRYESQTGIEDAARGASGHATVLGVWRGGQWHDLRLAAEAGVAPGALAPEPVQRRGVERRLGLVFAPGPATGPLSRGVVVETANGSALLAGIERGDHVLAVNGVPVASPAEFDAALARIATDVVALLVDRPPGLSMYLPVRRLARSSDAGAR